MIRQRRLVISLAAAWSFSAYGAPALAQQAYPAKPLHLYVAFAPGGAGDTVARLVSRKMTDNMGQPVIVENRPSPVVAALTVAKSKPDGYSTLMAGSGTALTSVLFKTLPYDLMKDFRHVSSLASFDLALITGSNSGLNSVADVLAYAKARPGKLNIGTVRIGSTQNLTAEMFKSAAGIDATIVPYKSTAEIISAVRSNDVQLALEILPPILGQITGNNLKALAIASKKRFAGLPSVPTLAESGFPGFEATSWNGVSVPADTPDSVVNALATEIQRAVASPEVQKELQAQGMVGIASTPQQMTQHMKEDMVKWKTVIDRAGIPQQ